MLKEYTIRLLAKAIAISDVFVVAESLEQAVELAKNEADDGDLQIGSIQGPWEYEDTISVSDGNGNWIEDPDEYEYYPEVKGDA